MRPSRPPRRSRVVTACLSVLLAASARAGSEPQGETDLVNGRVATRAGPLRIARDDEGGQRIVLGDRPLSLSSDPDESSLILSFEEVARLREADVVLVEVGSGGSSCPSDWVFLTVAPNGATRFSRRFGNCSPVATMTRKGETLHVTIREAGGNPAQHVAYEAGRVTCDTCLPEMRDSPLPTVGGTLAIEKSGPKIRITLDGKPIGIEGPNLFRAGAPVRVGSEDVVLVQRDRITAGCFYEYLFVAVGKGGTVAASAPFGNCTSYPSVDPTSDGIDVSFPAVEGHRAARFRYRDHQVVRR